MQCTSNNILQTNQKKKSGNNDHNLNYDDINDDNNNKKEDTNEDEGNLVTAHIAGYDQMSGYEQVSALIDEGHGYYDMDNGFNNDIIGLHAAVVDDSYELNNAPTDKPNQVSVNMILSILKRKK